jgi:hypothetical protein
LIGRMMSNHFCATSRSWEFTTNAQGPRYLGDVIEAGITIRAPLIEDSEIFAKKRATIKIVGRHDPTREEIGAIEGVIEGTIEGAHKEKAIEEVGISSFWGDNREREASSSHT